jgi:ribonuclease Z
MRSLLSIFAIACALASSGVTGQQSAPVAPVAADEFRVTLLGTGSPMPVMRRFGPGVLVQAGGQNLLIDAGRGGTQRLLQVGLKLGAVDALFLTHLHSDHVVGIPDLWLSGWLEPPWAQRKGPFRVYGQAGSQNLMDGLAKAYDWDIKARIADQKLDPANIRSEVTEIKQGVIYEKNGVRVTAFDVDHGELLHPAFGFRIDYAGRSVSISGDTKFNENLIRFATNTDLLIHQVAAAREELAVLPAFKVILEHHTKPEEAGVVFTRTKPRLAVYYHFVLLGTPKVPPMTEQEVVEMTRKTYAGPLLVGEDLMAFRIDADRVVQLPQK